MAIPSARNLMLPILERLVARQWQTEELTEALADQFNLSDAGRHERLASGERIIRNRTSWALVHLGRLQLAQKVREKIYEATEAGKDYICNPQKSVDLGSGTQVPAPLTSGISTRNGFAEAVESADRNSLVSPEERIEIALKELQSQLETDVMAAVRAMSPLSFEQLTIRLILSLGYGGSRTNVAQHLGRSNDGGVDGVIREDVLGLHEIYVQAKKYGADNIVGAEQVRGFIGALSRKNARNGVFITSGRFTATAQKTAEETKGHRVVLIDGKRMAQILIDNNIGVRTVSQISLKRLDHEQFDDMD